MDDNGISEELNGKEKPAYISVIIFLLKIVFFVYDVIVYIPFKIFADPSQKLSMSQRTKSPKQFFLKLVQFYALSEKETSRSLSTSEQTNDAKPVKDGDPSSAWRHITTVDKELRTCSFENCRTLADQWNETVRKYADRDCFGTREVLSVHYEKQKNGKIFEKWEMGKYHWRTFRDVDERTNMVASALSSLGLKKNDHVVIFAETREEWMTTAIACFKSCLPVVTIYATLGEEAVEFALQEVNPKIVFASENLLAKLLPAISEDMNVETVVYYESHDPASSEQHRDERLDIISFTELLNKGKRDHVEVKCSPRDIAFIMYTSGTTGNPKGVMITHENVVAAATGQGDSIELAEDDIYIGYLPLAHILEVCAEMVTLTKGVRIGYSSAQTLFDRAPKIKRGTRGDCYALRPTLMACVPAVMDRIYKAVIEEVNSNSLLFREMFKACYERKRARYEDGYTSFILNKLVFNRIGSLLGGHIRQVLSGGAPLSPETQRFMNICFCCPVFQGYGLTETCGGGTIADSHDLSTGSVGPPLTCCEILLEEWAEAGYSPKNERPQGEILIGGKNVALGYFKNEEKTKVGLFYFGFLFASTPNESQEDFVYRNNKRYFATGDIGEFREDGSLMIIGKLNRRSVNERLSVAFADRKKDLLKLAFGEYISLGKVETHILTDHYVETVCAYGDSSKDYLVALVVPERKNLKKLAEELGVSSDSIEELCKNKKVVDALLKEIQSHVSGKLERMEIPKKIYLCSEPWTPASGLVTEALKVKRRAVEKAFHDEICEMYS
ncbi:AMP-binding enzyme [Oesophagostomum dentatum]|uniref:long-chain-fatty-acid--CoA ligase n=1 Tax=Oesophagostomum dentatum TaxID=61180 RepID=A0A0B1TUZ2_OESDE|nr:AMP-binding enzyme [Oesophagostomum dentatum]